MQPSKLFPNADDALADLADGATIMVGGCGALGVPHTLLRALSRRNVGGLTCIGEACQRSDTSLHDISALIARGQVSKLVSTPAFLDAGAEAARQARRQGILEVETVLPGLLAERIRAGGAGVGAFLVTPQADPLLDAGKERQVLDGQEYVVETSLKADFALIRAHQGDLLGNLVYRGACRNWNPVMATAAAVVVVQVDAVVEPGELDPERVITPGIYVDRLVATDESSNATAG